MKKEKFFERKKNMARITLCQATFLILYLTNQKNEHTY